MHDDGETIFIAMECPMEGCNDKFQVIWRMKDHLPHYPTMNKALLRSVRKHLEEEHSDHFPAK